MFNTKQVFFLLTIWFGRSVENLMGVRADCTNELVCDARCRRKLSFIKCVSSMV